jgi:predicted ATPase
VSLCIALTVLVSGEANGEGKPKLMKQLTEAIAKVRTEMTLDTRTQAAEHLANLTLRMDPSEVDDKTLGDLISLLATSEDSVRAWVAVSLGNLGPRAKKAVPKLLSILAEVDCLQVDLSSAPAIRVALTRMGVKPPPEPTCGSAKK